MSPGFSPADLREMHELHAADWICDIFARAARMGRETTLSTKYPTPFHCWVAELGIREGQAVRGAAAARHVALMDAWARRPA